MARPNLFIAGAPKCGTSSMYYYLNAHPDIFMSERKEPRFFGADLELREGFCIHDEAEYEALFRPGESARYRGEASVFYLYSDSAAEEIRAYDPSARILLQLRDPIEMIQSWHHHGVATCNEDIVDLGAALDAEEDRRAGRRLPPEVWYRAGLQYRAMVDYAPHVERFFDVFGRDNVHVVLFDDLSGSPADTYRGVLEFLGVDPTFQPDFEPKNPAPSLWLRPLHRMWIRNKRLRDWTSAAVGPSARREAMYLLQKLAPAAPPANRATAPSLGTERRAALRAELRPGIDRLGALLDRDLSAWSGASLP